MKRNEFWKQVDQRVQENNRILNGGLPHRLAPLLRQLGLNFLPWGMAISLGLALIGWQAYYSSIVNAVRVMIWR